MKQNENAKITGQKVTFIPYEAHHVPKYHSWMQSPELQELTASEPLSLEQEYEMQRSWREDEKKCTFIVLQNDRLSGEGDEEIDCMIGDVNIFLNEEDDDKSGEIEIMIAETKARGKGCGKEALFMMMRFGIEILCMDRFTAKIGFENIPSLTMFQGIGFSEISRSDVFKEVTLELKLNEQFLEQLGNKTRVFEISKYR